MPMAAPDLDAKAKSFQVEPGKAAIYVYRNETMGGAITMPVSLNGRVAGKTGPNTYFMWSVDPGQYEIASLSSNTSKISINTEAGYNYFIWQEVKMGMWVAGSKLQQVSSEQGQKGVMECKLAASEF